MVSGPTSAWERVRPLLEIFGRPFFMGETAGAGQTMKLVNNLLGACAIAITAEGMTIGAKAGLDPKRMIEVLNVSSGPKQRTQDKWPRAVLPRTFDFGFACWTLPQGCAAVFDGGARSSAYRLSVGTAVLQSAGAHGQHLGRGLGLHRDDEDCRDPTPDWIRAFPKLTFGEMTWQANCLRRA